MLGALGFIFCAAGAFAAFWYGVAMAQSGAEDAVAYALVCWMFAAACFMGAGAIVWHVLQAIKREVRNTFRGR